MAEMWWPLMDAPTVKVQHCVVCGKWGWPLNQHHMVPRSAGELYRDGEKVAKPTITLCGSGNASGCHGLAHQHKLNFDYRHGRLYFLKTDEPVDRLRALEMEGWVEVFPPWEEDWDYEERLARGDHDDE